MNLSNYFDHFFNFIAPALWLALWLPLLARLLMKSGSGRLSLPMQMLSQLVLATTALAVGLWFFGHDGKMATYLGMTLLCASGQWLMQRGWRAPVSGRVKTNRFGR